MRHNSRLVMSAIFLLIFVSITIPVQAVIISSEIPQQAIFNPSNTVLVSNRMDARFSQDFSVLLKQLDLEWVILDSSEIPDSVKDKHLILLGHPDSEYSGAVIREFLTAEDIQSLKEIKDQHMLLELESPWMDARRMYIASGADPLHRRNAAEAAIRAIIAEAPPASDWIRTTYESEQGESLDRYLAQRQYEWEDGELPLQDLIFDVEAKLQNKMTSQEAEQDVERLFYLLSHGYSGYGFFNQQGEFEQAKTSIVNELRSESTWSSDAFTALLHKHLNFIVDTHMSIGDYRFAEHQDFWYDTELELMPNNDGFQFEQGNQTYQLVAVNGADPTPFILPSLNQEGEPIYRLGMLTAQEPSPLMLTALSAEGEHQFEIQLQRSDFDYFSKEIFREDTLGGIPVVRMRSFSDINQEELAQFVETGSSHRGDPVVIVDIRGNGGGNERWPSSWIQQLTGSRPEAVFVYTELESKTSLVGRANAFAYWVSEAPDPAVFRADFIRYSRLAEAVESGARQARWTEPRYPRLPLIANVTTVILVTNERVASAGEGMVMRISQAENVMVIGENTMGALTFGNISTHQLPNSKIMVWLPINFGIFMDQEFREGVGLLPDLWVPAADAVNFAAAAVRQGTIPTFQPIPQEVLETQFIPESNLIRAIEKEIILWLAIVLIVISGIVLAYTNRNKPRNLLAFGFVSIMAGGIVILILENPIGYGFLCAGIIYLLWGGFSTVKLRQNRSRIFG